MILETKFDIDSEVFFLVNEKIYQGKILNIEVSIYGEEINPKNEVYRVRYIDDNNKEIYSAKFTRNELFNSIDEIIENLKKGVQYLSGSEQAELNKWGQ